MREQLPWTWKERWPVKAWLLLSSSPCRPDPDNLLLFLFLFFLLLFFLLLLLYPPGDMPHHHANVLFQKSMSSESPDWKMWPNRKSQRWNLSRTVEVGRHDGIRVGGGQIYEAAMDEWRVSWAWMLCAQVCRRGRRVVAVGVK
jgi:hypothetical protein